MTGEGQQFDLELLNVLTCKNDLMDYLKSLADLNGKMSKDATNYANLSSIVKERLASFKSIFGESKSNLYCDEATIVYSRLLKTFRQYEPEFVCKLYDAWKDMLSVFSKSSRANSFIKYIHKFECIVEYLQSTNDRCNRLIALSVIRRYTKKVNFEKIRDLYSESISEYIRVIQEIILISHQQKTTRTHNAFLSACNSKNGLISSFQPNQIVYGDELYVLANFEMWIDFNIRGKSISFTVISVTKDQSKNLYGFASRKKFKIVSRQGVLVIKSIWSLSSCNSETKKMSIEFCFNDQIYTSILDSKLGSVFKITIDKADEPVNNLKTEAESTLKLIPSSINEMKFVEPEKLETSTHSAQNVIQRMVEDTAILAVPNEEVNFDRTSERQEEKQAIEVQSAAAITTGNKLCVKTSTNENEATVVPSVKNEFRKRRNGESGDIDNDGRSINVRSSKRVCKEYTLENPSSTEAPKHQSLAIKTVAPSVNRDIEMNVQDRINRSNGQHIHNMAEVILMAAGNMIRTLQYTALNAEGNEMRNERKQEVSNRMEAEQQCAIDLEEIHKLGFDTTVYKQKWIIRKFVDTIAMEPDYGEEIDENLQPISIDIDVNETYDSVSNPKLIV